MSNFLNEQIKINFSVPPGLKEYMDYAEKADKDNDAGNYYAYIDAIDTIAKNCYATGSITKEMQIIISQRYH